MSAVTPALSLRIMLLYNSHHPLSLSESIFIDDSEIIIDFKAPVLKL